MAGVLILSKVSRKCAKLNTFITYAIFNFAEGMEGIENERNNHSLFDTASRSPISFAHFESLRFRLRCIG